MSFAGRMPRPDSVSVILIGGSAGSVAAVQTLLKSLKLGFRIPIIVVQHISPATRVDPSVIYGRFTDMKAVEAEDKMPIEPGTIYFAPSSYHLLIERDLSLSLSQDELVHFSRPSIEVLFESVANWSKSPFGMGVSKVVSRQSPQSAAVLLTGANSDGGAALCHLHEKGSLTLVQDPKTAEVATMPMSALQLGYDHEVLGLQDIGRRLSSLNYEARL